MKNNRIAIFTTFYEADWSYSLCNVVADQIKMLTRNGYKIKVLVDDGWKEIMKDRDIGEFGNKDVVLAYIPKVERSNEGILKDNWREEVEKLHEALRKELDGYKVCITHDVIFQAAHLIHNMAARRLADERKDLRWIHWIHSCTAPGIRCSREEATQEIQRKFPNSFIAYPNDADRQRVANNYKYELDEVKCVHHPIDIPEYLGFHPLTRDLIEEKDLLSTDVIAVYPIRLDRGKQVEWPIRIMGAIKRMGKSVRLIVMNFHSTGGDKVIYRQELEQIAKEEGLEGNDITFMSEWREETHISSPRQMVRDLMLLSNLYIHASTSETYSLTTQEAIICKNLIMLNHNTLYMRDIYGSKYILYEPMGSAMNMPKNEDGETVIKVHDKNLHFDKIANKINYFLENDPVLGEHKFIRQRRNLDYVFKKEFEHLLYYEPIAKE